MAARREMTRAQRLRRGRLNPKTGPGSRLRGGGSPSTWANEAFISSTAYHGQRPHQALGYLTPDEYREKLAA